MLFHQRRAVRQDQHWPHAAVSPRQPLAQPLSISFLFFSLQHLQRYYHYKTDLPAERLEKTLGHLMDQNTSDTVNKFQCPPDFSRLNVYEFPKLMQQYYVVIDKYHSQLLCVRSCSN